MASVCLCGKEVKSDYIKCMKCSSLQHYFCYKVEKDTPKFLCYKCRIESYLPQYNAVKFVTQWPLNKGNTAISLIISLTYDQLRGAQYYNLSLYCWAGWPKGGRSLCKLGKNNKVKFTYQDRPFEFNDYEFAIKMTPNTKTNSEYKEYDQIHMITKLSESVLICVFIAKETSTLYFLKELRVYSNWESKQLIRNYKIGPGKKYELSLYCPLKLSIIENASRGSYCSHPKCFDAKNYIDWNILNQSWVCPICNEITFIGDLIIDSYINSMIRITQEKCKGQYAKIYLLDNGDFEMELIPEADEVSDASNMQINVTNHPKIDLPLNDENVTNILRCTERFLIQETYFSIPDLMEEIYNRYPIFINYSQSSSYESVLSHYVPKIEETKQIMFSILIAISLAYKSSSAKIERVRTLGMIIGKYVQKNFCYPAIMAFYDILTNLFPQLILPTTRTHAIFIKNHTEYYEYMVAFYKASFESLQYNGIIVALLNVMFPLPRAVDCMMDKWLILYWEEHFLRPALMNMNEKHKLICAYDIGNIFRKEVEQYYTKN